MARGNRRQSRGSVNQLVVGVVFILLGVGALVGTWSMAGAIATFVHLGIQFLNPNRHPGSLIDRYR